jgi:hypothetical protein
MFHCFELYLKLTDFRQEPYKCTIHNRPSGLRYIAYAVKTASLNTQKINKLISLARHVFFCAIKNKIGAETLEMLTRII